MKAMSTPKDVAVVGDASETNVDAPGDVMLASLKKWVVSSSVLISLPFAMFLTHTLFYSLYGSSKLSDFFIKARNVQLKVHKLVLVAQSGYFSRMFDGDEVG